MHQSIGLGIVEAMSAFVYMLRCSDGSYYVGSTRGEDVARRVSKHQQGLYDGYTAARLPP